MGIFFIFGKFVATQKRKIENSGVKSVPFGDLHLRLSRKKRSLRSDFPIKKI